LLSVVESRRELVELVHECDAAGVRRFVPGTSYMTMATVKSSLSMFSGGDPPLELDQI